ncbi:2Fe-2S iron-sulfur cluster-binding protein [Streptomyces humi]
MNSSPGDRVVQAPEPSAPRTGWYRLPVTDVRHLGTDAVALLLGVPTGLRETFTHRAGQHVVVRHPRADGELRRSYSVCPPPGDPTALRLVIQRGAPDGFGAHAATGLRPGDRLLLSPPAGGFVLSGPAGGHHVLIAGGSGITPLIAMAAEALREDPHCRVTLVHVVRTASSALLADEVAELKDAHLSRLSTVHVRSRANGAETVSGRPDASKLKRLLAALDARPGPGTGFALCGPPGLVDLARRTLAGWGAEPDTVRAELFSTARPGHRKPPGPGPAARRSEITAVIDGRSDVVTLTPQDGVLLDALIRDLPDVPYACREGVCGSCRAKVVSGTVSLGRQHVLDSRDLAAGYTLACLARPTSHRITLDFDS